MTSVNGEDVLYYFLMHMLSTYQSLNEEKYAVSMRII